MEENSGEEGLLVDVIEGEGVPFTLPAPLL